VDEKVSSLEGRVADGVDGSMLGFIREEIPGTILTSGPSAPHPLPLLRLPSLSFTILLVGMDQRLDSSEKKHQAQLMSGPSAPHPLPLLRLPSLRFTILLVGEVL
jgi:hypothetical protein